MKRKPPAATPEMLALDRLTLNPDLQPRAILDREVIEEYADAIKAGRSLPPAIVFRDGQADWLADGFHRHHAYRRAGKAEIPCEIREGTRDDAKWFAAAANQAHGLRRSNADKAKAVQMALEHPNGAGLSDRQIATHVGVGPDLVAKQRRSLEATGRLSAADSRKGLDGRTINIGAIGRRPVRDPATEISAAPAPAELPEPAVEAKDASPPITCPCCGGHEVDEDGDCSRCHEPGVLPMPGNQVDQAAGDRRGASEPPATAPESLTYRKIERLAELLVTEKGAAIAAAMIENLAIKIRGAAPRRRCL